MAPIQDDPQIDFRNEEVFSKYDLKKAVKLPEGESCEEWIAHKIFDFHKQICMLFGTISDHCTEESCPKMMAGKKFEYSWVERPSNSRVDLSAAKYISHLLDWVQEQLDDEKVFPSLSENAPFPENFIEICQTIARRLFRVYAHIYHHHLQQVQKLKEERHMNTSLNYFTYFVEEFKLLSSSDMEPLKEFIECVRRSPMIDTPNIQTT